MIARGELLPHFSVAGMDRKRHAYSGFWQRRNLALIALRADQREASERYAAAVSKCLPEIQAKDAECIVTYDTIEGVPAPAVVVADRWGEVQFSAAAPTVESLPSAHDIVDWLEFVQVRCPEWEGEAR